MCLDTFKRTRLCLLSLEVGQSKPWTVVARVKVFGMTCLRHVMMEGHHVPPGHPPPSGYTKSFRWWQHKWINAQPNPPHSLHNTPSHVRAGAFQDGTRRSPDNRAFPNERRISFWNWKVGRRSFSAFVSVPLHFDGPFIKAMCGGGIFYIFFSFYPVTTTNADTPSRRSNIMWAPINF